MNRRNDIIDRLVERIDRLDAASVQGYVQRLVREKAVLENVFQTIREGVLIVDEALRLRYVNAAAIRLLGLPQDPKERENQPIGRYLRDVDWKGLFAGSEAELERVARQELEVFYPRHRFLQFYVLPYHDKQDEADGHRLLTLILHDVTDLHEHTESTIESEKLGAITMLAAGVAHEIGNPLNSLNIHLQLLQRYFRGRVPPGATQPDEETTDAAEMLQIALDEVKRLDTIINQFLKAVRPSPLELTPLYLTQVIGDTLRFMKPEIEDRGVHVECNWPDEEATVMGDAGPLKQAFYNIIKNAVQAMPEGGLLRIGLETRQDRMALSFQDNGKGIAASELSNIFDPYYTSRPNGTGLGLVIVERIVREHGATLGVESEVGVGTCFTISFPLSNRPPRLLDRGQEQPPEPGA